MQDGVVDTLDLAELNDDPLQLPCLIPQPVLQEVLGLSWRQIGLSANRAFRPSKQSLV